MANPAERLEAVLLGCDHPHSVPHLETLISLPEVTTIHLWDPGAAAPHLAGRVTSKPVVVHESLDAVLSDSRITWGLASLRNDLAGEILLQCAAAGLPVLAEKPIGRDLAETAAVVGAFANRGVSLAVCFQNRYKPAARQIREWLTAGHLGRLTVAETRLHTTQVGLRLSHAWLFSKATAGGGILPWLGCHYLDLLRFVTGSEVVSVTAHCATLSGEAIDVEDVACLTLAWDNGMLATGTFGYLMPQGQAGYINPGYDSYLGLKGTAGHLRWEPAGDPQELVVVSHHDAWLGASTRRVGLIEEPDRAYGQRYGLEFARDCVKAAQTDCPPPASGEDLLAVWRMIEAAYTSAATGQRVAL